MARNRTLPVGHVLVGTVHLGKLVVVRLDVAVACSAVVTAVLEGKESRDNRVPYVDGVLLIVSSIYSRVGRRCGFLRVKITTPSSQVTFSVAPVMATVMVVRVKEHFSPLNLA